MLGHTGRWRGPWGIALVGSGRADGLLIALLARMGSGAVTQGANFSYQSRTGDSTLSMAVQAGCGTVGCASSDRNKGHHVKSKWIG